MHAVSSAAEDFGRSFLGTDLTATPARPPRTHATRVTVVVVASVEFIRFTSHCLLFLLNIPPIELRSAPAYSVKRSRRPLLTPDSFCPKETPRRNTASVFFASMSAPVFKLVPGCQSYDWGKRGQASLAAQLASKSVPGFKVDESKPYAEVSDDVGLYWSFAVLVRSRALAESVSSGWARIPRFPPNSKKVRCALNTSSPTLI
jgi:hypothetical protein